ncbi:MAG: c-type cytochrome [Candidatus Accumulibacter sp.]|jgi:cytochrome c553|uniref:c-type cytochrome n=1 Tax=Accumulibacter sp. TaxID=2053492 RepID=UPI001A3742A0|nr:c-type cytochrome [Accumulibacter sp.]MBL8367787.1 c-type cytochrome [Accumulibacter sp.]HRI93702.1 c-type cytochrome [Accumulibacter sp.]
MTHFQGLRKLFYLLLGGALVLPAAALDIDRAKDIYGPCAACHGPFGAGGKQGEYPRIAGQLPKYVEQQLLAFQSQVRINLPMYPYTRERELDDQDMKLVAAYLAQIELPTRPPEFKDSDDALARLLAMEKVMIIPRAAGDIENGKAVYQKNCAVCHGKTAQGRGMFPMLVGQYTNYLQKQIDAYLQGDRPHDEEGARTGALYRLKDGDSQDVLAYLTTLQAVER